MKIIQMNVTISSIDFFRMSGTLASIGLQAELAWAWILVIGKIQNAVTVTNRLSVYVRCAD